MGLVGLLKRLRSFDHDDSKLRKLDAKMGSSWGSLRRRVRELQGWGFPYRVFLEKERPIGLVVIGCEPYKLRAPFGTPFVEGIVLYPPGGKVLNTFVDEVWKRVKAQRVEMAFLSFPDDYPPHHDVPDYLKKHFTRIGFLEYAGYIVMYYFLGNPVEVSNRLRYEWVQREDVARFIKKQWECMRGVHGGRLELKKEQEVQVPKPWLDDWYNRSQAYFAYCDDEIVGTMSLNLDQGWIQAIGVIPSHRRKGYGSEILRYSLRLCQEAGHEEVYLQVDVDNQPGYFFFSKCGLQEDYTFESYFLWRNSPK